MNNLTKFNIARPVQDVFEALADPSQMANYWFSSGSGRLEQGKIVTWRYEEYNAEVNIKVLEVVENGKIVYQWGAVPEGNVVTISFVALDENNTRIEVLEEGFDVNSPDLIAQLLDNKEGWVYALTCLKAYLEFGVTKLRAGLVK